MSEERYLLIHDHVYWELDITPLLLGRPGGTYTGFMGSIYRVPAYVFDRNEKAKVLVLIIQELLKSAPEDTPATDVQDLKQLGKQLVNGAGSAERLEQAERKLMMTFGRHNLPQLLSLPEELLATLQAENAAKAITLQSQSSDGWAFFIGLSVLVGLGLLLWWY